MNWIKATDQKPLAGEDILICYDNKLYIGYRMGNMAFCATTTLDADNESIGWQNVTYWMKLPELPK